MALVEQQQEQQHGDVWTQHQLEMVGDFRDSVEQLVNEESYGQITTVFTRKSTLVITWSFALPTGCDLFGFRKLSRVDSSAGGNIAPAVSTNLVP
jgi:hypothetical protein